MKNPSEIMEKLTQQSSAEKQSIIDWLDFLYELKDQIESSIDASENDLEKESEED